MNRNTMIRWGVLALVLAVVAPLAAVAQQPDVIFHNNTRFYIDEFYFDWAQSDEWSGVVLLLSTGCAMLPGKQALEPGGALGLYTGGHCWWDIKLVLVDGNGDRYEYELDQSINFCQVTDVYFSCNQNGCWWSYE